MSKFFIILHQISGEAFKCSGDLLSKTSSEILQTFLKTPFFHCFFQKTFKQFHNSSKTYDISQVLTLSTPRNPQSKIFPQFCDFLIEKIVILSFENNRSFAQNSHNASLNIVQTKYLCCTIFLIHKT